MKIGVFGSKMDPIHIGHLILSENAREQFELDLVYFITTGQPVDKQRGVLDGELRHEMVMAALAGSRLLVPSRLELDRPGPSYMFHTVEALTAMHGAGSEFFLILGADRAPTVPTWHRAEELSRLCHFLVGPRDGKVVTEDWLATVLPTGARFGAVDSPPVNISSSLIRKLVSLGRSVRYLVPDPVNEIILRKGHYRQHQDR